MAVFAGITLGDVSEVLDVPNPKRFQLNAYPGANGRERIDLGTDGGRVEVYCAAFASDLPSLAAFESTLYAYQAAGTAWPFLDNFGVLYPAVILVLVERAGRILPGKVSGGWCRRFKLTFEYDT